MGPRRPPGTARKRDLGSEGICERELVGEALYGSVV